MAPLHEFLLLVSACLCGCSLGALFHGMWKARSAERAQAVAWGTSRGLRRGLSRPPRVYRHRGSVQFALLLSASIAAFLGAWITRGSLPDFDLTTIALLAAWGFAGILACLFPLACGLPLGLVLGTAALLVNMVVAGAPGQDGARVTVDVPLAYRLVAPSRMEVASPADGSLQKLVLEGLRVLPGLTISEK